MKFAAFCVYKAYRTQNICIISPYQIWYTVETYDITMTS